MLKVAKGKPKSQIETGSIEDYKNTLIRSS